VGEKDKVTPPQLSEALYRLSPLSQDKKSLVLIPGAGHDDVLLQPAAVIAYRNFFARLAAR
jgi:pimeloyl-ACP methyl ester carboxylesterase